MTEARGSDALRATQVLHCNLNVVDLERAGALYEQALALTVRMRSEEPSGDSTPMGIDGPTHSLVWFLYDHRGGRHCPAIELVEWRTPPTAGHAYEDPTAIGMQALGFVVPSVAQATNTLERGGATRSARVAHDERGDVVVAAELLDHDGVRLELVEGASGTPPTFTSVRVSCRNLEASTAWYSELGWHSLGAPVDVRWEGDERTARVQRLALPTHPFELHLTAWATADRRGPAHARGNERGLFRMALAVDDVRAACEEARRGGRVHVGMPQYVPLPGTPLGGLWVSFFRDPDGVMVELVERSTSTR
jgi:catechol 2,3-dioxygenase-like lactoylglutathione lyase family enzyme